jgi:exodeoxyribonuclease V alpha subunit
LTLESTVIMTVLEQASTEKMFAIDTIDDVKHVFPTILYYAEKNVVKHLERLLQTNLPWGKISLKTLMPWVEGKAKLQLSESQKNALFTVFQHKISIITGGPGVGKTTLVNCILMLLHKEKLKIELCAPTGRAAKRLNETTGLPAKTIHRLLGFNFNTKTFMHNQDNPLDCDVLIVDESSMIDLTLFLTLLKAIPDKAAVILVGDVDQLPSVGSGAVLSDLIQSHTMQTIYLTEIFRQAAHSKIVVNAHRINQKQLPVPNEKNSDFYMIKVDSAEAMQTELLELVTQRLPSYLDCDPIHDIQVLTPMHRGYVGTQALNKALQEHLNGRLAEKLDYYETSYAPGDKVIQTMNNYDEEIFNGDIGIVRHVNIKTKSLKIQFDKKMVEYSYKALKDISLAYAITVHKSQGSEYPVIVIPLATEHKHLLAKNLLYTGVTRGKKMVVLILEEKALSLAINNNTADRRITKLKQRLQQQFEKIE